MTRTSFLPTVLLSMILAGCSTGSGGGEKQSASARGAVLALEEVAARPLPAGRCSLIMFSRETPARRIVVAYDNPAEAIVRTGGEELALQRRTAAGEVAYGHAAETSYTGTAGLSLTIRVTFDASPVRDGAPIRDATITLSRPSGETVVVPAVGVAACTPA